MTGNQPVRIAVYGCDPDEADAFRELAPGLGAAPVLTAAVPTEATAALASGARCVSVGHKSRVTPAALHALARAGVDFVSTRSIGRDHIDVACAERLGITVRNVAYEPDGVADYTLMLMLMALRGARSLVLRSDVHDYRPPEGRGRELRDLTVGVVGTGRIGTAVIARLRGFGCRVLAFDRAFGLPSDKGPDADAAYTGLDELLRESDVVTLHTPLDAGTRHLLDRGRIALMRPGAVVVNTGRGPLLDTAALLDALEGGALGGAALDVLEGEEGVFYSDCRGREFATDALPRLQKLPNVIVSPHSAYYTDRVLRDTVEHSITDCVRREEERTRG